MSVVLEHMRTALEKLSRYHKDCNQLELEECILSMGKVVELKGSFVGSECVILKKIKKKNKISDYFKFIIYLQETVQQVFENFLEHRVSLCKEIALIVEQVRRGSFSQ